MHQKQTAVRASAAPTRKSAVASAQVDRQPVGDELVNESEGAEPARRSAHWDFSKVSVSHSGPLSRAPPIVHEVLGSPGQPLESATRTNVEPRFGTGVAATSSAPAAGSLRITRPDDDRERDAHRTAAREPGSRTNTGFDFSRVRVHTGARASTSARAVNARAYTVGSHIVFGEGGYAPQTLEGQQLLLHELAHVVQHSSGGAPMLARVVSSPDDFDALIQELQGALAGTTVDVTLIYVALQRLEHDRQAIATLRSQYKARFSTDLDADLRKKLSGPQLSLALQFLGAAAAANSTASQIAAQLNAALAAKTVNESAIFSALLPLSRNPTLAAQASAAYKQNTTRVLEDDLKAKLSGTKLAYALYLLNAPPPETGGRNFQTTPNTGNPPATPPPAVEGGQVSALTQVQYPATGGTRSLSFGVTYTGGLTPETRWLQFIWRELEITAKDGTRSKIDAPLKVGTRSYHFTKQGTPVYSVDSDSPTNPFYESSRPTARREPNLTMIGDAPSAIDSQVKAAFDGGATDVVSTAHFDIYLIRDYRTLYHVEIEVAHVFKGDKDHHTTRRNIKKTETVSGLPADMKQALVKDYPAFSYIQ